jgi:predicted Zn finger-like uncharacterized protein
MRIQTTCTHCGASYALDEQFLGKKGRCKKCNQSFVVTLAPPADDPGFEEVVEDELQPATEALEPTPEKAAPLPRFKKKKKREEPEGMSFGLKLALGVGVGGLLVVGGGIALMVYLFSGSSTPKLVGKWKGAPQVRKAIDNLTGEAKAPPVAQDFLKNIAQKAADELLAVTLEFKEGGKDGGTVFFSGNTDCIGVPGESFGPWSITQIDDFIVTVKMGPEGKSFTAKLAFKDRDNFIFTRLDKENADPIAFSRVRD